MARTRRNREDEERELLAELKAKYEHPARRRARRDDDDDDDDGSPLLYLTGRRADAFLDRMFGEGTAAELDDDDQDDDDDDDQDDDDDDDEGPDPEPPSGHGFFRSRRGRG